MIGYLLQDALSYPPHGVRYELELQRVVESLDRVHEPDVSGRYEIGQWHASIDKLLGDRYYEPEIGGDYFLAGPGVTVFICDDQVHLFL
jgi:hypothetical protein